MKNVVRQAILPLRREGDNGLEVLNDVVCDKGGRQKRRQMHGWKSLNASWSFLFLNSP